VGSFSAAGTPALAAVAAATVRSPTSNAIWCTPVFASWLTKGSAGGKSATAVAPTPNTGTVRWLSPTAQLVRRSPKSRVSVTAVASTSETISAMYASFLPIMARPLTMCASARVLLVLSRIAVDGGPPRVGPQVFSSMWALEELCSGCCRWPTQ
jgi:hypothetical protein